MNDRVKKAIKRINESGLSSEARLGDLLAGTLFVSKAVFIDSQGGVFVLSSTADKKQNSINAGLLLTELIATVKDLESSHLVYVVNNKTEDCPTLFYSQKTRFQSSQFENRFDIGGGEFLIIDDSEARIETNGRISFVGSALPKALGDEVSYYLSSLVYPTEGLKDYINHGFQTEELMRMKCANRISIISVIIAISVAVTAPFFTVWWGNSHGWSTINHSQFNRLLDHIDNRISEVKDSSGVSLFIPQIDQPFMSGLEQKRKK